MGLQMENVLAAWRLHAFVCGCSFQHHQNLHMVQAASSKRCCPIDRLIEQYNLLSPCCECFVVFTEPLTHWSLYPKLCN